jgi:hypothetical protein
MLPLVKAARFVVVSHRYISRSPCNSPLLIALCTGWALRPKSASVGFGEIKDATVYFYFLE